jgi:hypothetical protein
MNHEHRAITIEDEQRRRIVHAMNRAGLSLPQVWLHYFSISGAVDEYEIDAYLNRLIGLPGMECDKLAHAVNELINDLPPLPRAPYRNDIGPPSTSDNQ